MGKRKDWAKPGDTVELRGKGRRGVLAWVNSLNWCSVEWEGQGPKFCHLYELEPVA